MSTRDNQNNQNNHANIKAFRSEVLRAEIGLQATINKTNKLVRDGLKLNNKVKVDTGKFCNARCNFCYYLDRVKDRDFLTITEVLDDVWVTDLLDKGIRQFEFSGGEPTLCWDLGEIIDYIRYMATNKNIDPKTLHFSIVTNGFKLRDKYNEIIRPTQNKKGEKEIIPPEYQYVEEILFSLHGHKALHESITKISNSYDKIIDFIDEFLFNLNNMPTNEAGQIDLSIKNLNTYVKRVRVNVVVGPTTFNNSEESVNFQQLLLSYILQGIQVNLLPINSWDSASDNFQSNIERYQQYGITSSQEYFDGITNSILTFIKYLNKQPKHIKSTIHNKQTRFRKLYQSNIFNIRYFSLCLIPEEFKTFRNVVVNHYNHIFDALDWNKVLYPMEATSPASNQNRKNIYPPLNNSVSSNVSLVFRDANRSHFIDKICKDCNEFKKLRCDGQKYSNQETKEILYDTKEIRKNYVEHYDREHKY